jgi:aspartokinase
MAAQSVRKIISLDGIKLSQELTWLHLQDLIAETDAHLYFVRQLSQDQINLPFIITHCWAGRLHLCCCVPAEDENRLRGILRSENSFGRRFQLVGSVGLISMFPHRNDLRLLYVLIDALKAASLTVYGFASSISSLTFVTDYAELDSAVAAIKQHVDLPRGFVPLRPEFRIRQRPLSPGGCR